MRWSGDNVHLVTVNDYLAKRDAEWNKGVYDRLGVTVGCDPEPDAVRASVERRTPRTSPTAPTPSSASTTCATTWPSRSTASSSAGHVFAIVDEVDSILIDEARTPLIISGEPETAAKTYYDFARIVKELDGQPMTRKMMKGEDETELSGADYLYDEKFKTVSPAQTALDKVERALGIDNLYDPRNVQLVNHLSQALKAQSLYKRDVDYVVQDGEVKIVDEFTGRIMEGRRWSEGLHQAIEAKEGVHIREENVTLATITLQNYFRLYDKLAGMTGTAKTEEKEFVEIYNLHVVEIPTNVAGRARRRQRLHLQDQGSEVGRGGRGHRRAPRGGTAHPRRHDRGRDVRVPLRAAHAARHPAQRAQRQGARAGERRSSSSPARAAPSRSRRTWPAAASTSRSTTGVVEVGGLYVLGTERHEARRIDNQLRGRSGRQGDPGETRFYLSAQDDLVRLFAGDRIHGIMDRFKIPDDQPMEAGILSRQIENAQKKVEEQNFVARKNVLKYDDVMNTQRMVIYEQRGRVLRGEDMSEDIRGWIARGDREQRGPVHRERDRRGVESRRAGHADERALRDRHHDRRADRGRGRRRRAATS